MAFSIFGKNTQDTFAVFDIGNNSIVGDIVKGSINENGHSALVLLGSERAQIPLDERVSFETLLKKMIRAVSVIAEHLSKKMSLSNLPVHVVLASPWYISQTKIVTIKKDGIFTFSEEVKKDIINKEAEDFKNIISKKSGSGEKKLSTVESEIMHISLNGYETTNPIGNKVNEVKLAIYSSVVQEKIKNNLQDKITEFFPHAEIIFHSFPLAYFYAVKELFPEKKNFLMVDVGGEITEVSLVRRGILIETFSFPLGRNFLIRRIASGQKRTISEAESLNSLLLEDSLSMESKEKLSLIVAAAKTEWISEFGKALANLSGELYVPNEVFLSIDNDISTLFTSWIEEEALNQYTLSHEKFIVMAFPRNQFYGY